MKIAVSACLLGENCKYNGGNNFSPALAERLRGHEVIPVCPEKSVFPTPRPRVERRGDKVFNEFGEDVTALCSQGVARCLDFLKNQQVDLVVLQSRSPTCGVGTVYDGTFSGTLTAGNGLLAEALQSAGYAVLDVADFLANSYT